MLRRYADARRAPSATKRNRIGYLPARRPAVHIGCEGVTEKPERRRCIADLEVAECQMPAQMTI
jgi:hypothetical protein